MPKKWIPLESNPEVITEFASRIGLDTQQWAFHDVFGLDEEVKAAAADLCRHASRFALPTNLYAACM
jgi:hypothetical protein